MKRKWKRKRPDDSKREMENISRFIFFKVGAEPGETGECSRERTNLESLGGHFRENKIKPEPRMNDIILSKFDETGFFSPRINTKAKKMYKF